MEKDIFCGRCKRKQKESEHFDFHSGIVIPTHFCPRCEKAWENEIKNLKLFGKLDNEWNRAFENFKVFNPSKR